MNKLSKLAIALGSTLVSLSTAYAGGPPNNDHPTTFLGPTARVGFTSSLWDTTAFSLAGEAGVRNYRASATLGWKIACNQYFKVTAEYLWQKINYAFYSGNSLQWVRQGALGAAYQYDLMDFDYAPQFDLNAYISHAPSKNLSTVVGSFINTTGIVIPFTDERRIAGSNAWGASPGVSVAPWDGSRIGVAMNYDNVRYDIDNGGPRREAKGLGGTVFVNQALSDMVGIGASAAIRKPYTNYAANINFTNLQYYGDWSVGLFGNYLEGKKTLPDTWNVGISADYFLDQRCPTMVSQPNFKGERNYKGEMMTQPVHDNLLAWTADPAVYMPQVLAIADPRTSVCGAGLIKVLSDVPDSTITTGAGTTSIATASHFTPNVTTYTSTFTTTPVDGGTHGDETVSINSAGVVSITTTGSSSDIVHITVTAANGCNSVSTSFDVFVDPLDT